MKLPLTDQSEPRRWRVEGRVYDKEHQQERKHVMTVEAMSPVGAECVYEVALPHNWRLLEITCVWEEC